MWKGRVRWSVLLIPLLALYLWPTVGRSAVRRDVVVIGDGAVVSSADELGRQFRERGLLVDLVTDLDPCEQDALRSAADGAHAVVISFLAATVDRCRTNLYRAIAELDDPVIVAQDPDGLVASVDATRLVPVVAGARIGCEWWEPAPPAAAIANCEPDGSITVRDETGELTPAGRDRFARVVAGAVP